MKEKDLLKKNKRRIDIPIKMKNMHEKIIILAGILGLLLIIAGFVYISLWMIFPITPTDVKIVSVLEENEELLLSIDGIVAAGIARNESNHIIGIAIYIEDSADIQKIPKKLGEFDVFVKKKEEAPKHEKKTLIYMSIRELRVLKRYEDSLMKIPGVVGIGIGECYDRPSITVYLEKETPESRNIPKEIEGVKIDVKVIGSSNLK